MTTVSDMPLADATGSATHDGARASTRALTRARASLTITTGDGKIAAVWAVLVSDLRRWWLIGARPMSLRSFWRTQRPAIGKVPCESNALRRIWVIDNWTTGLLCRLVATLLLLVAGGMAWLGGHPMRRWTALLITAMVVVATRIH